jgi:glycosyltransferase involved in cell wall biosynthesis
VVIANTITIPLWTLLGRMLRRPVLVHVHEAEGSVSMVRQRVMAAPLLLATALVANSRWTRDVLTRSFARLGPRTSVIYNGVAGPASPVPPRPTIQGSARLLFVGRLSPRKGPAIAIQALAHLRRRGTPASLDVVGDSFAGYEWFADELRRLVQLEGVADAVRFHGFVSDIWRQMAQADVVLVPSQADESFGNSAIEAVLGARPLVVTQIQGLLEATEGFAAVKSVPPGDADALAGGIDEILSEWTRFAELAERDARIAVERFAPARYRRDMLARVAGLVRP